MQARKFGDKKFGTYSLMVPKQIIGVLGAQMAANFVKRLSPDDDFDGGENWDSMAFSWARDYRSLIKEVIDEN
jgi:hypothetical protein